MRVLPSLRPPPAATGSTAEQAEPSPFWRRRLFSGNFNTRVQTFFINLSYATNTAPSPVYNSQRNGLLAYVLPGLAPGAPYTLRLHFAETNSAATSGPPTTLAGYRTFNVSVNGAPLLTNFDIAGSAIAAGAANGYGVAVVREFPVKADANGKLHIHLSGVIRRAQINGLEVLPLPATAPAAPTGFIGTALPGGDVLSWSAVPGATSYQFYRSTTPGATGTLYKTVTGTAVADPASTGGFYYYRIAALNPTGPSALTADIFATLDLATWKSVHFTSAELQNPLVSGDTATAAGDGAKQRPQVCARPRSPPRHRRSRHPRHHRRRRPNLPHPELQPVEASLRHPILRRDVQRPHFLGLGPRRRCPCRHCRSG